MSFDVVIRNGRIIDGTGNPWYKADLGLEGGRIAKISRTPLEGSGRVIDVRGLVVSPGFINIHSHSDGTILTHNRAENCLAMGLVTECVGNCGTSAAPITEDVKKLINIEQEGLSWGVWSEVDWLTLGEWFDRIEHAGIGINIATLVGHSNLRRNAMGEEGKGGGRVVPTEDEMEEMRGMLDASMDDGAFGLSTGLSYPLGRNALTEELAQLAGVAAAHGGVYSSHMRNEGPNLIEATLEFIEICERSGARGSISHHKASGLYNFGKVHETLRLVDQARSREVDVIVDMYPWRIGGLTKSLGARFRGNLPEVPGTNFRGELVRMLKDPEAWKKMKTQALANGEKAREATEDRRRRLEEEGGWSPSPSKRSPSGVVLHSPSHPELEWKTLQQVGETLGGGDELEGIRALLIDDDGYTVSGNYPYSEEDMAAIVRYPWATFITDQRAVDNSKMTCQEASDALRMEHPRGWGTYPKVLESYVREERLISLEDAVRKITSLPATFLGLNDRGLVKEGFWADLVVFDPENVRNRATYGNPFQHPEGIPYVIVNGEVSVDEGRITGELAGRVLKNSG
ncbi:MAG TPA: D-aminoacylase [Patescibacteria group bacterium]|nr:D-aminoacylase [Patescibacteria group bacterium]